MLGGKIEKISAEKKNKRLFQHLPFWGNFKLAKYLI